MLAGLPSGAGPGLDERPPRPDQPRPYRAKRTALTPSTALRAPRFDSPQAAGHDQSAKQSRHYHSV
jgi:hypothetical protein